MSNQGQPVICTDESAIYRHKCLLTVLEQTLLSTNTVQSDELTDGLAYMVRALIDDLDTVNTPLIGGVDGEKG